MIISYYPYSEVGRVPIPFVIRAGEENREKPEPREARKRILKTCWSTELQIAKKTMRIDY